MAKQQITLSPEALAALRLPVDSYMNEINDKNGTTLMEIGAAGTFYADCEIAAALAQLINAAFTPAAEPAPESDDEFAQPSNPEMRSQVAYYDWTNDGEAVMRQAVGQ